MSKISQGWQPARPTVPGLVRLTQKHAQRIDGIDLSGRSVGDVFRLTFQDASMLIAEGWAEPVGERRHRVRQAPGAADDSNAD